MTQQEALNLLAEFGINPIRGIFVGKPQTTYDIGYKGEVVGYLTTISLAICDYIPSLIDKSYQQTNKAITYLDDNKAEKLIRESALNLINSPIRYETYMRKYKLEIVKEYFSTRKAKSNI